MRILLWILAILTLTPLPAAALDPDVSEEVDRIVSDPTTDVYVLAEKAHDFFFSKVRESCSRELQTTQEQREISRILHLLDASGILLEQCGTLDSRRAKIWCATSGAEALRMVAALKGNPMTDIEWESPTSSYFALRDELLNAAWLHCRSIGSYGEDCLAKRQAELLGYPAVAGSFCAEQRQRRCLDALLKLVVYLEAMHGLDSSRQL